MAVNSTHPDYDAAAVDWARARDVLSGEDAVKAAGEKYLPRLDSQTEEEFAAYRQPASFDVASCSGIAKASQQRLVFVGKGR